MPQACAAGKGSLRRAKTGRALAACARSWLESNRDGRLRQDHCGDLSTLRKRGTFYFALTVSGAYWMQWMGTNGA